MKYVQYFLYIAWNWNIRLAFFILYYEWYGERKYKQKTIGIDTLEGKILAENRMHASIYQPVNYYSAERLFDALEACDKNGALLDMGCGKGRLLGIGAAYGFTSIVGVDFCDVFCIKAWRNATRLQSMYPDVRMEIICADAAFYDIPVTVSVIFLFNPFDHIIIGKMLESLNESLLKAPRKITVIYANPVHKALFIASGFTQRFYFKKMTYLEGCILEKTVLK